MLRIQVLAVLLLGLLSGCVSSESDSSASAAALERQSAAVELSPIKVRAATNSQQCPKCGGNSDAHCFASTTSAVGTVTMTFTDNVTNGNPVTKVEAKVYGVMATVGGGSTNDLSVYLNTSTIGTAQTATELSSACNGSADGGTACDTLTFTSTSSVPDFAYGASNTLKLELSRAKASTFCVSYAEVILTTSQRSIVVTPASLTFGNQQKGTSSVAQTVTLRNNGEAPYVVTGVWTDNSLFTIPDAGVPFTLAPDASTTLPVTFRPTATTADAGGTLNIASATPTPKQNSVPIAGTGVDFAADVSPVSLAFGEQRVGVASASFPVTVRNVGGGPLQITAITSSQADYTVSSSPLPLTITAGDSATLSVTFTPATLGDISGTLTLQTDDTVSPSKTITLTGKGVKPVLTLTPISLSFSDQRVGTLGTALTLRVENTGTAPLNITSLAIDANFELVTPPSVPFTVAAGAFQNLAVRFKPTAEGDLTGNLTISSDDPDLASTLVPLSGKGVKPALTLTPTSLAFSDQRVGTPSTAKTVTVTNTGSGPITINNLIINTNFELVTPPTVPFTLAANGGSQTISVRFKPTVEGDITGATLTLSSTDPDWASTPIPLTGKGVRPVLTLTPTSLAFPDQRVNAYSAAQTVTVKNTGSAPITFNSLSVSNAAFELLTPPTTPFTLAAGGGTQALSVRYKPTDEGSVTGNLTLTSSDSELSSTVVSLSGKGVKPLLALTPSSLSFGQQRVGVASTAQTVTVKNTGTGPITITALTLNSNFEFATPPPEVPFTLAATTGTQALSVRFKPTAEGAVTGATLTLTSNDADFPSSSVTLAGEGVKPALVLTPSSLSFGDQRVGVAGTAQTVKVENTGSGPISITGLPISTNFELVTPPTVPFTVLAGAFQNISVRFKPTVAGALTGNLTLSSNDPDFASTPIALSGTGVKPILTLTPSSLAFGDQRVGVASEPQTVTVKNTGTSSITITALNINTNFELVTPPTLPFTLAPNDTQSISLRFKPTIDGNVTGANLTLSSNDPDWLSTNVPLTGKGVKPALTLTPTSLAFSDQRVGTPSTAKTVSVRNTGTGPITITALDIDPNFELVTPPTLPFTLAASGGAQTLSVRFKPTSEGNLTGNLTLTSSDWELISTVVPLSGKGVKPLLALTPSSLDFGKQRVGVAGTAQMVTVTNTGTGPITITAMTLNSHFEFVTPPTVPFTLAATTGTQTLSVRFKPTVEGVITGATLTLTSSDADFPSASVALAGEGVKPQLSLDPGSLAFGDQRVNVTSAARDVVVTNVGSGPITISSLTIPTGFDVTPNASFTLAANGGTRTLSVRFTPSLEGSVPAGTALKLNSSDADWLSTSIALSGRGVRPKVSVSPVSLAFGEQRVGNPSPAQTVTVQNTGTDVLRVTQVAISAQFGVSPSQPFELPVNETKTLSVTFNPTVEGDVTGAALTLSTDDPDKPTVTVSLTGKGVMPTLSVTPAELLFGEQPVNSVSTAQTVTVKNTGLGTLTISNIAISAGKPFSVTPSADFTLQKDQTKTLSVTFLPTTGGEFTGTLSFNTNDPARQTASVTLSGIGVNPQLSVSPTALAFGAQAVGSPSTPQTVTVSNPGNGTLRITSISITAGQPFEVIPNTAFDLPGGTSRDLAVTFRPTSLGSATGTLTVRTNSTATPMATVSLSGNGVARLEMSPTGTLDFGLVKVGGSANRTITFTNSTSVTIKLTSRSTVSAPFSISGLTIPAEGLSILPGATHEFTLTYSPSSEVQSSARLIVVSDAFNSPHQLDLLGTGVVPRAKLSLPDHPTETSLDFGDVRLTTGKVERVRLTNEGDAPLVINQPVVLPSGSPFSYLGPSSQTIPAKGFLEFQVSFRPKDSITTSATLSIPSDAANSPSTLNMVGKGTYSEVQVDRANVFFGDVRVGDESTPVTVKISNPGTAPLTVQSLSVTGPFLSGNPSLPDGGTALPLTVPSNNYATFNVRYKPTEAVVQNGSVTILTDANVGGGTTKPDGGVDGIGTVNVALQGSGTIAELKLAVTEIDFGKQRVDEPSGAQLLNISNPGKAALEIEQFLFSGPFSVAAADTPPFSIPAGRSKAVAIIFTPTTLGAVTGKLSINSNAAMTPAPLNLKGEGADGQVVLTPSVITFTDVEVGGSGAQQSVILSNNGGASLKILGVNQPPLESGFKVSLSVPSTGLILAPNAQLPFTVNFLPTTRGYVSDFFTIVTDARINPNFTQAVTGRGVAPAVTLDPTALNFGKSNVGMTVSQNISIKNVGEKELSVSNISFADETPDDSDAALDFLAEVVFPVKVPPNNGSVSIPLKFTPRVTGMRRAQVVVHTNDKEARADLLGEGTSPILVLDPSEVDFGSVLIGNSSTRTLRLTNNGTGPLKITSVVVGGLDAAYFTSSPLTLPITLPAKAFTEVSLTMKPDAARALAAVVVVESDDKNFPSQRARLFGSGVQQQIPVSPSSLEFGQQLRYSTSSPRKLTVTNASDEPVMLATVSVEGPGSAQFLPPNLALPRKLLGKESLELDVRFNPVVEEEVSGTLKLSFSEPQLQIDVPLHGKGIPTVLALAPAVLDFSTVRVGSGAREQTLTITNLSSELIKLAEPKVAEMRGEQFIYDRTLLTDRQIEPGVSIILPVKYNPQVETLSETQLVLGTTIPVQPNAAQLSLLGRATTRLLNVDIDSLDFGRVDVGNPVETRTVTVFNRSAQQQRVVVKLRDLEGTPFSVTAKELLEPLPSGASATFTVSFDPEVAGSVENEVQVWLQGDTAAEVQIPVMGHGRSLTGVGGGCSCDTGTGAAGMLALLALVGLGSRRRRRA